MNKEISDFRFQISDLQSTIYNINFAIILLLPFVLLMNNSCFADDPHPYHTDLQCSDCHTMHYSEGGAPIKTPSGESYAGPSEFLIRADSVNLLCLSCHDSGTGGINGAPDVWGVASYETPVLKRAAGSFQGSVGVISHKGHSLGVVKDIAPGSNPIVTFPTGLTCVSCHDAHGNGNYRSLKSNVGNGTHLKVSYINGIYSGSSSIFQVELNPTSIHYSTRNIQYRRDTPVDGLSQWCKGCHTNFHGTGGEINDSGILLGDNNATNSAWVQHPITGVTMSQAVKNQHLDSSAWFNEKLKSRLPVVSPSNQIPGTNTNSDNQVACITCHKAHGSTNPFGLIYDNPLSPNREDGTSLMQSCQQCHNK